MNDSDPLIQRHLVIGWWAILIFLTLGIFLEAMHGFKIGWYLNVSNEARRMMFRMAHAHGVLFGLVNIALAMTIRDRGNKSVDWQRPSFCISAATVLIPVGFFLAGIVIYGPDPGLGILLVPIGAVFLFVGVLLTVLRVAAKGS